MEQLKLMYHINKIYDRLVGTVMAIT